MIPLQRFQWHIGHCLLGHDNKLSHGLTIQPCQCLIWVTKRISRIFKTVTIMTEPIHTTNHPHWPQMDLDLTNMFLQLKVDDTITISTRLGITITLESTQLDTTDEWSE